LKPFHYIHDALVPIERHGFRVDLNINDPYHQPKAAAKPRASKSPHSFLRGCITTGGPEEYHYSGSRKYTPRELCLFQSFPYTYKFTGTKTNANVQIGNAFPPIMAEALYRTITKTLEISDIDALLESKGVSLPRTSSGPTSMFAPAPASRTMNLPYRYLKRDENRNSSGSSTPSAFSPFSRQKEVKSSSSRTELQASFPGLGLLNGLLDDYGDGSNVRARPSNRRRHHTVFIDGNEDDPVEIISTDSESE
jgi:DNA (cytosine-5)-methyltransferase 1